MKKMNNVMKMMKNVVFDLFVIVGGLAVIIMICKAVFNTDKQITTVKSNAATVASDEAKYSEGLNILLMEVEDELNEELYSNGKEANKDVVKYEKNIEYLYGGMYKVVYTFNIYGNDELQWTAYIDVVEEDGVGCFTINGVRIDEDGLDYVYPDIFD